MYWFMIAAIVVFACILLCWLVVAAVDGSWLARGAVLVFSIVGLGALMQTLSTSSAKGPCHEYRTQMMYNAATKTMMPSRVCVLRGEWVEETE